MPSLASLPAKDADRLAKLAGLLGSDSDGERANAARLATDLLKRYGLTWRDALTPAPAHQVAPPTPAWPMPHQRAISECLAWNAILSDWEKQFLRDVKLLPRLTTKQQETVNRILEKVRRHAAREGAHA
jgi:hypothetical protein